MKNKVSIIIPTYNRGRLLKKTVESFICQSLPKDNYEIIIVDNNSTDGTKKIIKDIIQSNNSGVDIRYIFEKRQGVHFARNNGAKEAKNEILYFTDDDMLADKDLLVEILKVFNLGYNVGSATGVILPRFEIEPPEWILKYCYNSVLSLNPKKEEDLIISSRDIGVFSCHQAIDRKAFFKSKGFNPENTKGEWVGDGETGLNIKIKRLNYKFAFSAKSIIYHLIPKERLTQKYLNKRLANQGNSNSYTYYRENNPLKKQLYLQILKHFIKVIYSLQLTILLLIIKNFQWHLRWALVFYWIARIKYDFKLIKSKEWREFVLKSNWLDE